MSSSHLLSHRLFVSALAQETLPPVFEETRDSESSPVARTVPLEVLPKEPSSPRPRGCDEAFEQKYDW
jgi:hypothetical protein